MNEESNRILSELTYENLNYFLDNTKNNENTENDILLNYINNTNTEYDNDILNEYLDTNKEVINIVNNSNTIITKNYLYLFIHWLYSFFYKS